MPQSFGSLHFHLVCSTKNRQPLLDAELQPRLYEYIGGILRAEKSVLLAAGGMPDHVHLLVSLSRELSVAETWRLVKANSSKWIHATFPDRQVFAWQAGYGRVFRQLLQPARRQELPRPSGRASSCSDVPG